MGIKGLKPLVKRVRRDLPPQPGETLRTWMQRLSERRPDRAEPLRNLLGAAEQVVYGDRPDPGLKRMAAEEARHWG